MLLLEFQARDAETLLTQYNITPSLVQWLYAILFTVLIAVFIYEPQIRHELADGKSLGAAAFLAGLTAIVLVKLNIYSQAFRLSSYPISLWLIIAHLIVLCAIAVALNVSEPSVLPSKRIVRYSILVISILIVVLSAKHLLSVGRFMGWNFLDEPDLANIATSYTATGVGARPYLASTYGIPDPMVSRHYLSTGLWLRAAGISLVTLREFALIVAVVTVLIVAIVLFRVPDMTFLQRLVGIAALIALSPFVRASHSIRPDIGLSVYGALVLMGLLFYFRTGQRRWIVLLAGALIVGMETVPAAVGILGITVGIILLFYAKHKRAGLYDLAIYSIFFIIPVVLYFAIRLLPDIPLDLQRYLNFATVYRSFMSSSMLSLTPLGDHIRSSLVLSPVESVTIIGACIILIKSSEITDRLMVILMLLGVLAVSLIIGGGYLYMVMFSPLAAYIVARVYKGQLTVLIGAFVLLPALLAAPMTDLSAAIQDNSTQAEIAEADLLTRQISQRVTIVAPDIFWFTLHADRQFIGWFGLGLYVQENKISFSEAFDTINIDIAICFEANKDICDLIPPNLFAPPSAFYTPRGKYLIYRRNSYRSSQVK